MRYISVFAVFIFFASLGFAQELIVPAGGMFNPELNKNTKRSKQKSDTLELPFYDDFSYFAPHADTLLWENSDVYVNSFFAANPPTRGMATFDALDKTGAVHQEADYQTPFIADLLTSKPIDLNFPDDNSIYLSFFYAPQGYGDYPDVQDSLVLEFLDPENQNWEQAWFAEGSTAHDFRFVIVPVNNEKYLKKGFRFRFKNYVSFGSAVYADLAVNMDHWHLDLVYLNRERSAGDNTFEDMAVTEPLSSLLQPYSAVPYEHFIANPDKFIAPDVRVAYKNNDNKLRLIDSLKLTVADYPTYSQTQTVNAGSYNVPAGESGSINIQTGFNFSDAGGENLILEMKARLVTASYDRESNNSITRYHELSDYYAYDDGSAEAGYGLYGAGTRYGRAALKFYTEKPADIEAVRIYFGQSLNNETQDYFFLNIWRQGEDGLPESEPAFSQQGVRPEYADELNAFQTYELDEPVFVEDTFFVGWTQTQAKMLNVGFDLNTRANQYLYYNISGVWEPSLIEGALMVRPVMKNAEANEPKSEKKSHLALSPNPAKNFLKINFRGISNETIRHYEIYSVSGRQILRKTYQGQAIDLSCFTRGIYLIKVYTEKGRVYTEKFAVIP